MSRPHPRRVPPCETPRSGQSSSQQITCAPSAAALTAIRKRSFSSPGQTRSLRKPTSISPVNGAPQLCPRHDSPQYSPSATTTAEDGVSQPPNSPT